jgi:sporulation protein YlmC with PRC-barrel domain
MQTRQDFAAGESRSTSCNEPPWASPPRLATGPGPSLMGADTLIGNDVYSTKDEKLGDIKELMIDMASGQFAYAVLSFGGFLGMGDKLFAVPWKALTLDTKNHRFTLNVAKDALKNAPGFDKDHWPSMADSTWASSVHKFYGTPYQRAM